MPSMTQRQNEPASKVFYKYRGDSSFTEQIFAGGQVYLSTADGLNDPFECSLQDIGKDWIAKQLKLMKQGGVAGFLLEAKRSIDNREHFFGLDSSAVENVLKQFRGCGDIEKAYDVYVQFIRQQTGHPPSDCNRLFSGIDAQLNSVGIFSMSRVPDHPLMWAHYAAEHTGICIGFEPQPGSRMNDSEHFLAVEYSDSLPEMNDDGFQTNMAISLDEDGRAYTSSLKIAFNDKTFQKAITTKPACWGYEQEWRYIEPQPGLFAWPGAISELTFGLRCPDERRKHYIDLAEQHVPNEVRLFEVRKRQGTNSLQRIALAESRTTPRAVERPSGGPDDSPLGLAEREFAAMMERLIRQEKYGEALFQIDENMKTNPDASALWHLKGVAHGYAQQPEHALQCFTRLTQKHPQVAQGWYQMSCALTELGRHEEAVTALKRAFALDPNDASTAFNLGVELLQVQDTADEALVYLRRAERLGHRRAHTLIEEIEAHQTRSRE